MSDFVAGTDAGEQDFGPVTIYDIQSADDTKVRVRALPRLTRQAHRLARAAAPREFIISTLLQIIGGGGIALLLLLGQQGLQAILNALQQGQSLAAVAPWAIAIAIVAGIESFVGAVQRERQGIDGIREAARQADGLMHSSARCRTGSRPYSGLSSKVGQISRSDSGNA